MLFLHQHKLQREASVSVLLKSCADQKDLEKGFRIHENLLRTDWLEKSVFIGSALVSLYAKCGALNKAKEVFNRIEARNSVSWNALIGGYAQHGHPNEALQCFHQMWVENIFPDSITFVCTLKACGSTEALLDKGKEIHLQILNEDLLMDNVLLGNALIDMYSKCGSLTKAQETFDEVRGRNVATWNSIICGYIHQERGVEAFGHFRRMLCESLSPNAITFVCILKACGILKDLHKGIESHAKIVNEELLKVNMLICTSLVDMYARCHALARAQRVFDCLLFHGIVIWTALIGGYAENGYGEEALKRFEQMQHEGVLPNAIAYICILKACCRIGALEKGKRVHAQVSGVNLHDKNTILGTTLVDMYAKCGALGKAQEIFDELEIHNVITWNVLITGYAQKGHAEETLYCLEWMQLEGFLPNAITFICTLNACSRIKVVQRTQEIHSEIVKKGLVECSTLLGNTLVDTYVKCGVISEAEEVFDKLRIQDVACWNTIISGYVHHGYGERALDYFQRMQEQGISPNAVTFVCILKSCGSLGLITKGEDAHAKAVHEGLLELNVLVGNAVVDMYIKCGELVKAREVFDELPIRDVVSWNIIITGCAQLGLPEEVLNYFDQMQHEGLSPNAVTLVCILTACSSLGAVHKGEEIHVEIVKEGLSVKNVMIGTALVDMYAKFGELTKAQEVFDRLQIQDTVAWNALILGYTQQGHDMDALDCYERMQHGGLCPDVFTLSSILKACGNVGMVCKGAELYAYIIGDDVLAKDLLLCTALLDMFIKFGDLVKAKEVFDKIPVYDIVSWNTLIAGYVEHGYSKEAFCSFEQMQHDDFAPDEFTFITILKACGSIGSTNKGEKIHATIVKEGLLKTNISIGNALVDMYAKCGMLTKAREVFDELPFNDVVSWNVMVSGYAQYGHDNEVLNAFGSMQQGGVTPDASTFLCMLKACGNVVAVDAGKEIHDAIIREGLIKKDIVVGNALIDMYTKFSLILKAQEIFDELPIKDIVSWTVLISGYAQLGKDDSVIDLFNRMLGDGIEPDSVVFTVVLNACSHVGLVDKGQMYFISMSAIYGIAPTFEQQTCIVDLLSRAGQFDEAIVVIKEMYICDYLPVWTTLLGSCQKWGNVKVGKLAFDHVVRLDERCTTAYVSMSNIYAAASMQEDAAMLNYARVENIAGKVPIFE